MILKPVHFNSIPLLSLYMQITIFILQLKLEEGEGGEAQALSLSTSLNQFNQAYCPINAHKLT